MPIPEGITREHVLRALADLKAGIEHRFGEPTKFELVHEKMRYPPKALIGIAALYTTGRSLGPEDFSGGEAIGQANYVLRQLGFDVTEKMDESRTGEDWSAREVGLVVADYMEMLRHELLCKPYVKSEHRRNLIPQLDGRSDGSVEFKHQNISAVLVHMGYPYISGYKPRGNYQTILVQGVESHFANNEGLLEELARSEMLDPTTTPKVEIVLSKIFVDPPERMTPPDEPEAPWKSGRTRKLDFIRRDAENRRLGKLGEELVVKTERLRLLEAGRDDLANRVEWVSKTQGDGLGYDVRSFDDADDSERLVEVKTTGLGKFFPFYVTKNEVRCSEACANQYRLFRVFDFSKRPSIYVLSGALSETCRLNPVQFRAVI